MAARALALAAGRTRAAAAALVAPPELQRPLSAELLRASPLPGAHALQPRLPGVCVSRSPLAPPSASLPLLAGAKVLPHGSSNNGGDHRELGLGATMAAQEAGPLVAGSAPAISATSGPPGLPLLPIPATAALALAAAGGPDCSVLALATGGRGRGDLPRRGANKDKEGALVASAGAPSGGAGEVARFATAPAPSGGAGEIARFATAPGLALPAAAALGLTTPGSGADGAFAYAIGGRGAASAEEAHPIKVLPFSAAAALGLPYGGVKAEFGAGRAAGKAAGLGSVVDATFAVWGRVSGPQGVGVVVGGAEGDGAFDYAMGRRGAASAEGAHANSVVVRSPFKGPAPAAVLRPADYTTGVGPCTWARVLHPSKVLTFPAAVSGAQGVGVVVGAEGDGAGGKSAAVGSRLAATRGTGPAPATAVSPSIGAFYLLCPRISVLGKKPNALPFSATAALGGLSGRSYYSTGAGGGGGSSDEEAAAGDGGSGDVARNAGRSSGADDVARDAVAGGGDGDSGNGGNGKEGDGGRQRTTPLWRRWQSTKRLESEVRLLQRLIVALIQNSNEHRVESQHSSHHLRRQLKHLPLKFLGAVVLGGAIVSWFVLKVVLPQVMIIMYDQFLEFAHEIKDVANEIDEDKMKRMAVEFTKIVMDAVKSFFGGQVKEAIVEFLKFWKW